MNMLHVWIAAVAVFWGLVTAPAWAHDFYPWECCSARDCYELTDAEVEILPEGIKIRSTGEVIPHEAITRRSPDGKWHRCSKQGDRAAPTIRDGGSPCFWGREAMG